MKFKNKKRPLLFLGLPLLLLWGVYGWLGQATSGAEADSASPVNDLPYSDEYVQPIPAAQQFDAAKVALGRKLFLDKRLSANDTISCASCHDLNYGGSDNRVHSIGIDGAEGDINAPTVFNSAFNVVQFWDGRAATLEEQIEGPVNNPKEMGSSWPQVLTKLGQDAEYRAAFAALYADGITAANVKDAIAIFERTLVTPDSNFDQYLRGDKAALAPEAVRGWELFQSYGCVACHQGVNLGGNMYERMGLRADYFGTRGKLTEADLGRYNVTGNAEHKHFFRVPSLRNVALNYPYFHDGSAENLPDAVRVMVKYQVGRDITDDDVHAMVSFLFSLTGKNPEKAPTS